MKTGMTLQQLATTIRDNRVRARDFTVPTPRARVNDAMNAVSITKQDGSAESFGMLPYAHRQLGSRLQIPAVLYDRLQGKQPDLLAHLVNGLFDREPEKRMFRTLNGNVRAVLSDRYRRLDHWVVAEAVLPELSGFEVASCDITETQMYMKMVLPRLTGEIKVGEIVQAGVVIRNSEVGAGRAVVEPMIYRLSCKNGMVRGDLAAGRHHVGRATGGNDEEAYELFSDETLQADDRAFQLKMRDTVRAASTEALFARMLDDIKRAAGQPLVGKVQDVVEELAQRHTLSEGESSSILDALIREGDMSRWGLVNAITAVSQTVDSYDRASELERLGGVVLMASSN